MSGSKVHKVLVATVLGATLFASGCTPIVNQHGYLPVAADLESIAVGKDTKESILNLLGEPTTKGAQGDNTWYYVSYTVRKFAFLEPTVTDRQLLGITFNGAGRVASTANYGLEDGVLIDLNSRETVTGGRVLTFWQQMLGNVGNFSAESFL